MIMAIRTTFTFTLPRGSGIATEAGRKVQGTMRLAKVSDLAAIERDSTVQRNSGMFYVVLLSKVITSLGKETMITRKTIEKLEDIKLGISNKRLAEILDRYDESLKSGTTLKEILRRPKVTYHDIKYIAEIMENAPNLSFDEDTEYQIEVQVKYEGYIAKAKQIMDRQKKLDDKKIPKDFDYESMKGITLEAKQRLKERMPYNVGQASRISGVTPADISVLIMYLDGVLK